MKIITKHIYISILQILFITVLLTSLLLLSVDLFSNFDSYVQNNVSFLEIVKITILYLPQSIILVFAPATLFTITYFLSQMNSNNEVIALLTSGISINMIYKRILIMVSILTLLLFLFNENIVLQSKIDYNNKKNELFNISSNLDNNNIGLQDSLNNYIIYANRYTEKDKSLYNVIVVQKNNENKIVKRVDSKIGSWSEEKGYWIFRDVKISSIENDNVTIYNFENYEDSNINLSPNMFRNLSADIKTMYLHTALNYLNIQKKVNVRLWYQNMTDFLDRLFEPFAMLIMAIIACSIDYRGKKNVFLFSIFYSIILAVLYYVSKMIFQIMAKQSIINPIISSIIPFVVILIATYIFNKIKIFVKE